MWRYLVGAVAALALVAAGVVLFNRSGRPIAALAAAPPSQATGADDAALPDTVPAVSEKTREQKRFARYDKDRNGIVARAEFLAPRQKAFAKLDVNHDGKLSFDEWAVKTVARFDAADTDKSGGMTPAEFATTAPKRRIPHIRRDCPTPAPTAGADES